jgi:N-methylhydantoinase B
MEPGILLPPYNMAQIAEEIRDEEIEDLEGALDAGEEGVDPVTFSVVYARLEGIMSEMTETILATARNPILYGAKDFTCTLMNSKAKVLSMFDCLPVHVGTLSPALRFVIRAFKGDICEGDIFVNNASYAGNAHVGDWTMFAPIFYHHRFVAWAVNKCHIIDTGAHIPANVDFYAKDIYEEAIHFPAVRLYRNYKMIPDLIRLIAYNFRYPKQWYGDFLAQVGSLWVAEKRVKELCDRFGYHTVKGCLEEVLRFGDRKMTEEIKRLPHTTVEEEMTGEKIEGFFPDGVPLKMKLYIDPDKALITFDYRDMPDQMPFGYNLTYATARCSALQGTLPILDPSIPRNDGALDHIKVLLREGALAGMPRWPVGTSAATVSLCDEVTNLVLKTWAKVVPERALAGMGEYCAANFFGAGVDQRTKEPYTHVFYLAASGAGATKDYDGLSHMFGPCIMGNMGYESIELVELATPIIIWETCAVTDSGGPGRWRGGVALRQRIQPKDHEMFLGYCATGHTCRPFGLFGGLPGTPANHWVIDHATGKVLRYLPNAGQSIIKSDEEWVAITSGGGGFEEPLERDPEAVRDDVRDGLVSLEAARDVYRVVINTQSELYEVDYIATEQLRAEAKKGCE